MRAIDVIVGAESNQCPLKMSLVEGGGIEPRKPVLETGPISR